MEYPIDAAILQSDAVPLTSVDRALRALMILSECGLRGESLGGLSRRLSADKATVHRSLSALKQRSYVVQDRRSGRYSIGPMAMLVTERFYRQDGLHPALREVLRNVSSELGETVCVTVPDGIYVRYVDRVDPDDIATPAGPSIGACSLIWATASGRAMLSADPLEENALMEPFGSDRRIPGAEILRAAEQGYAIDRDQSQPGAMCVAVPVVFSGRAVVAVSVLGTTTRVEPRVAAYGEFIRGSLREYLPSGFAVPEVRRRHVAGNISMNNLTT